MISNYVNIDRSTLLFLAASVIGIFYYVIMDFKRELVKREDILIKQDDTIKLQSEAIELLQKQNQLLIYYYMNGNNDQMFYSKPQSRDRIIDPI